VKERVLKQNRQLKLIKLSHYHSADRLNEAMLCVCAFIYSSLMRYGSCPDLSNLLICDNGCVAVRCVSSWGVRTLANKAGWFSDVRDPIQYKHENIHTHTHTHTHTYI